MNQPTRNVDYQNQGFTLIEILLVLAIFITILSVSVPLTLTVKESVEKKQFFSTLEEDVLYMQSLAITSSKKIYLYVYPYTDYYELRHAGLNNLFRRRVIPKHLTIRGGSFKNPFFFNSLGTPSKPGTFYVDTNDNQTYRVTFPFGRGRFYVTKQ
jgi:competence protein ComGD